jgi:aryl-alcohol dehydrogenase-like predicted oxidoreductase
MACERSLERVGADAFDVLLLHNPDRAGYTNEAVWEGMAALRDAGLTRALGVAPGPANGFTLDVIDCLERFGSVIDWAMVILNPLEPWPGELVLPAAARFDVKVIARVVDYGGLFWDDVLAGHEFAQWDLAHAPVRCAAPTLIEETGGPKSIEAKRAELAATPSSVVLSAEEVDRLREIGDNTGSMALKGASPQFAGQPQPDRWPLSDDLRELAARWAIEPERALVHTGA